MLWLCCQSSKNHVCCFDFSPRLPACNGCFGFAARAPKNTSVALIFPATPSVQRMLWLCCQGHKVHVCCFDFPATRMLWICCHGLKKHVCCFDVSPKVQRMLWRCCQGPRRHVCCVDAALRLQTCKRCLSFAARAPKSCL